ncbi:MAG TPA: N-acetyl sugar amidotransferase [Anaerohalosphaeraceae bacterium]|nr:N-acetyl sugar amidotransferase [Anaerohalosphaeraceae bacterium]
MSENQKKCSRCVMPSICPTIAFDEKGVCNYCTKWDKLWGNSADYGNEAVLRAVMEKVRNKSGQYDCLSGLSGGKDSSYAIYLCNKYGLRQLAVTFDNGFLSDEGRHNIQSIVSHFSVGHVMINPGWNYLKKLYRHSLLTTGEFCSVCNVGIRATLYRTARLFKIRTIVAGTSPRTEADIPEKFFTTSNDYFTNVFKDVLTAQQARNYMYIGQIKRGVWHLSGILRWLQLPRYVQWKEDQILSILSKETGWKGTLWQQHTDCVMSEAKEYLQFKRFGFLEKAAKLSALIRDGQLTQQQAADALEQDQNFLIEKEDEIRDKIASTFELSRQEMDQAVTKKHWDYLPRTNGIYNTLKSLLYK